MIRPLWFELHSSCTVASQSIVARVRCGSGSSSSKTLCSHRPVLIVVARCDRVQGAG
ncbi:hypothetical protein [Lysobacter gummosus]|uniref:hypothetical protein n=1 Tax=Lysobacter gummosus TaxID=262324 RepID=UPI00362DF345